VSAEKATYSNFQASELIFWIQCVIPLLDDMADAFNHSFKDELTPGQKIIYDISKVSAMRRALYDRTKTAKVLFDMGVPFSEVNRICGFGVEEYEGWDNSHIGELQPEERTVKKNALRLLKNEQVLRNNLR